MHHNTRDNISPCGQSQGIDIPTVCPFIEAYKILCCSMADIHPHTVGRSLRRLTVSFRELNVALSNALWILRKTKTEIFLHLSVFSFSLLIGSLTHPKTLPVGHDSNNASHLGIFRSQCGKVLEISMKWPKTTGTLLKSLCALSFHIYTIHKVKRFGRLQSVLKKPLNRVTSARRKRGFVLYPIYGVYTKILFNEFRILDFHYLIQILQRFV